MEFSEDRSWRLGEPAGMWRVHRLQYLTSRFPNKWELTWGGLRKKRVETPEEKRFRVMKEKVKRCMKELEAMGLEVDPVTGYFVRVPSKNARYDFVGEEAN